MQPIKFTFFGLPCVSCSIDCWYHQSTKYIDSKHRGHCIENQGIMITLYGEKNNKGNKANDNAKYIVLWEERA